MNIIEKLKLNEAEYNLKKGKALQEFQKKEKETEQAWLDYFYITNQNLDIYHLNIFLEIVEKDIEDLNDSISFFVDKQLTNNYLLEVYQLHLQKKWKEKGIIEQLIKEKK